MKKIYFLLIALLFSATMLNAATLTVKANNDAWGTVTGGGEDVRGSVTITATPAKGCLFIGWYDQNNNLVTSDLSYEVWIYNEDKTFTAKFAEEVAVSVHVSTPGTLAQEIINAGSRAAVVTKLTVTGTLNEEDYKTMRESASLLYDIDLSGVTDTEMPSSTFSGKSSLKSIVLPESLTSIGDGAFSSCSSLTSITIPNSVTSIGNNAFYNCSSLTSITIPNSVTSIGGSAFSFCKSLTSITIPNSVTSIEDYAFSGCPLTDITCYAGVPPTCGSGVFSSDVYSSATLTVPAVSKNDYLITSPWDAFHNIETMDVTYYKLLLTSSDENMGRVTETKKYYTLNEVVEIWAKAYNGYKFTGWSDGNTDNPRTITMTGNLTLTANFAVRPYEVTLTCNEARGTVSGGGEYEPGSQVTITATAKEGYQFSYWRIYYSEWKYNTVYENPYTFEMGSHFYDIEAVFEEIPSYNVNVSSSNENWGTVKGGGIYVEYDTAVIIATPNEGYVFDYWHDSYYGDNYYGDTLLLEVHRTYNLTAYFRIAPTLVDGIYYYLDKENYSAVVAPSEDYTGDIVLPETVTHNRTIYDVTGIEYNAFGGTSITSLVVPNNIHSEIALYECYDLKVLKAHADFISDIDGLYDTNIEEVYYTGGYVEYVRRISSLKVIDLSVTENTELYRSLFREDADGNYEGFYNLRKLVLPNGLIKIHDRQFESLWLLEEVVIPEGVTEIPDGAFYNCHALSKVTLSKNLTSIGNYAFYSCHALENIVIPEGVTEIGNAAFYGCTYLENIELPYTLEEVGNNAFALCSKVKTIKAKAHTPPTLWAKTFYDVDRNTPVYVAEVAYDDYVADQYWGEFFNIIATPEYNEEPTDIENTDETSVVIYSQGGILYVEGVETDYNVFDASGRLIYTGRDTQLSLPRGVYMIHLGDEIKKIVL